MRNILLALLLLVVTSSLARGQTKVNLCQRDDEQGSGTNLAKALLGGGRIIFDCGAPATIRITQLREIAASTEIDGAGAITFDAGGGTMFHGSDPAVVLRLVGLTIENARHEFEFWWWGGSVVQGALTLEISGSTIRRSSSPIFLYAGSVKIDRSVFNGNDSSAIWAPVIEMSETEISDTTGIPVLSSGTVRISDSTIARNQASVFHSCTKVEITRSRIVGNKSAGPGGALRVGCDAVISYSKFDYNAADDGGAIYVTGDPGSFEMRSVTFLGNSATRFGGAIAFGSSQTPLTIEMRYTTFRSNRAQLGGAIGLEEQHGGNKNYVGRAVAFFDNVASDSGGAIYGTNANVEIRRGVFAGNSAGKLGGAILLYPLDTRVVTLANALFVRNKATQGGSVFAGNGAQFVNATIYGNDGEAIAPGAITPGMPLPGSSGTIGFKNSILAGGWTRLCGPGTSQVRYEDHGHNLQFPMSSCGGSIPIRYPLLIGRYAPTYGSPPRAAGDNPTCLSAPVNAVDVFGQARPRSTNCSIGAVEGDTPQSRDRKRPGSLETVRLRQGLATPPR